MNNINYAVDNSRPPKGVKPEPPRTALRVRSGLRPRHKVAPNSRLISKGVGERVQHRFATCRKRHKYRSKATRTRFGRFYAVFEVNL